MLLLLLFDPKMKLFTIGGGAFCSLIPFRRVIICDILSVAFFNCFPISLEDRFWTETEISYFFCFLLVFSIIQKTPADLGGEGGALYYVDDVMTDEVMTDPKIFRLFSSPPFKILSFLFVLRIITAKCVMGSFSSPLPPTCKFLHVTLLTTLSDCNEHYGKSIWSSYSAS